MLPYFYHGSAGSAGDEITLDEDNSLHIVQVLRMKPGELLQLTDGKGNLILATIADDHKKKCRVRVDSVAGQPPREREISIAISPVKNASRFEWFLEKATEIGVSAIIPLLSERTERQHFRPDRWKSILVSALLQSQQVWLPELMEPMAFATIVAGGWRPAEQRASGGSASRDLAPGSAEQRLIAHCLEAPRPTDNLSDLVKARRPASSLILIGPEGDFSANEVELALGSGFVPVTLGANRLRTETAGIVAAALLCT
jgi:16S rRNA (uracil1498-N3)-methyltransferase